MPNAQPDIEAQIARLEQTLEAERKAARRSTRVLAGASLLMLGAVSAVLFNGWSTLRTEWSEEHLAKSLSREMEHLGPMAVSELLVLSENLLPVFAQHGADQLESRSGMIEDQLATQLDALLADLQSDTRSRLFQAKQRIRRGTEQILLEQFPELSDPGERERMVSAFTACADEAINDSLEQFVQRYSHDVDAFATALGHFDMLGTEVPSDELQRQLIHLWLQAIDEKVMNS